MPSFRDFEGPGGELRKLEFDELYNKKAEDAPVRQALQLSDVDRELIVRWLTRDYRAVFGGSEISGAVHKE